MKKERNSTIVLSEDTSFPVREAYVRLRTNFIYTTMNGAYKSVVFTSCEAGEGKSTTVINLAISLAKAEKKVLILDCDMRKSKLRHYLSKSLDKEIGLSAILSNLRNYHECIRHIDELGFDIIFSGDIVPNPSELLGSENMVQLLKELSKHYDYILLDAPPVLSVSDPVILSTIADGVVFVVRHRKIKKKQIMTTIKALDAVGAKVLGTVMGQYDVKKDYSTYGYGGKKYYQYYYYEQEK